MTFKAFFWNKSMNLYRPSKNNQIKFLIKDTSKYCANRTNSEVTIN
jgi:hypothetical protein